MTPTSSCALSAAAAVAEDGMLARADQSIALKARAGVLEIARSGDERLGTIEFDVSADSERLEPARQDEFRSDFCRELARLKAWAAERHWPASAAPNFAVIVSDRFRISKSLVPAWSGYPGRMEFPAWRVVARKAAILHELVHVFFPNGNRLLAEGLAIYLQAGLGGNPAFPNFGKPLHEVARERLRAMIPEFSQGKVSSLAPLHLGELDRIATPSPLALSIGMDVYGEEPRGQAHVYPIAGSFVQHLIESRGLDAFRKLYERTPLVPLQQNIGPTGRWSEVYGVSLGELEREWKRLIAGDESMRS